MDTTEFTETIYQELHELTRKLGVLETEVQHHSRMIRRDEIEQLDLLANMATATQAQVHANSMLVNEALKARFVPQELSMDSGSILKITKQTELQRRRNDSAYRARMEFYYEVAYDCRAEPLKEQCPCGKHIGLAIIDDKDEKNEAFGSIVVDNMCPLEYWKIQSLVANKSGKLLEFLRTNPLDKFLGWYTHNGE